MRNQGLVEGFLIEKMIINFPRVRSNSSVFSRESFICFSFVFSIFYEVKFTVCLTNYFTLRTVTILSGIFYEIMNPIPEDTLEYYRIPDEKHLTLQKATNRKTPREMYIL